MNIKKNLIGLKNYSRLRSSNNKLKLKNKIFLVMICDKM
jgi:hypothetical protein